MRRSIGLNNPKMNKTFFALVICLMMTSCYRIPRDLEPKLQYALSERYLQQLPSPFPSLTPEERGSDWGKEYTIGVGFAKALDFYRAITAFRRAEILVPDSKMGRKLEMQYEIMLCYYLGRRYQEVETAFNNSDLSKVNDSFPAFHDLLLTLYDSYRELDNEERACFILDLIKSYYPDTYEKLSLGEMLTEVDLPALTKISSENEQVKAILDCYECDKKSVGGAQALNAFLPGAGYLYVGQKQTAVTAFLVNGLFIAASVHFFYKGQIAAGLITTSFEAGWYFGGIYGAGQEAKFYNERLYEKCASPIMNREGLFPVFMLNYSF
ncbi:MAG: hypothetical protein K940chlam2_00160 [Chlamydiae bacterium]|nr:hypothetical protein [Chlamydiota bacterium]